VALILVIDDDRDVCAVAQDVLVSAGHQVAIANDGAQGLELQRKAPADVVITDILMPEKEGLETIRDLKRDFPKVRIIAMSGMGKQLKSTAYLVTARELGADVVLRKPFGSATLLQSVQELLHST